MPISLRFRAGATALALIAGSLLAVVSAPSVATAACAPTNLPAAETGPLQAEAGQPLFFAAPGLCLSDAAVITVTVAPSTAVVTVTGDGTMDAGFTVTPPSDAPTGLFGQISIVDGAESAEYEIRGAFGPDDRWIPGVVVPNPLAVQVGVTAYYVIEGLYFPASTECEISVQADWPWEELELFLEPPNSVGNPIPIRVSQPDDGTDFKGIVTLEMTLACTPPGGAQTSHTYAIQLYVGIPIPVAATLPATGQSPAPLLAFSGMLAAGGLVLLLAARRRRHMS